MIPLELIIEAAKKHGVEPGWLYLYLNGYKRRVPPHVREQIEERVLGIDGVSIDGLRNAMALLEKEVDGKE